MIGAIAGDIIRSVHEFNNIKTEDFPLFSPKSTFTDDTVMTVAVADCILTGK
jgi:ADP-ribosylglycohydrolase